MESDAGGSLGEQSLSLYFLDDNHLLGGTKPSRTSRWARLGPEYEDEANIYIIEAPPGKLGVVVDTPDEGAAVVYKVKETSPLLGELRIGDRLLAVNEEDVSTRPAMYISRLITQKSNEPIRRLTLFRSEQNRIV